MTATVTTGPAVRQARSVTPLVAVSDIAAIAKRNLLHIARTPQLLVFSTIQPVMFVLLFRYVFGGAIKTPGSSYVDFLMAGIFVQTTLFGGASTAVGLAEDLRGGIVDRFRSLPMARSAVLAGRTFADLARNVLVLALMVIVATGVGFRFHNGPVPDLGAMIVVLAFGYAFSWVFAYVGLVVKEPETAQVAGFIPLFPLVFASSAFVPVQSMPGWLQGFANVQPVSVTVNATRALTQGGPIYHWLWQMVLWTILILVVFIPLAVSRYRRI
ncbi:MAG TPA: ABC transporter permease [Acidimicrobiales bacterium]|jgi:ABC-2 type transport system permease protein/oleandomycin transport system permease protein|nr:ABC transporter permease [Acidimicrobiales bacterium]